MVSPMKDWASGIGADNRLHAVASQRMEAVTKRTDNKRRRHRRAATSPNETGGTDACDAAVAWPRLITEGMWAVACLTSLLRRPRSRIGQAVLVQQAVV